MPANKSSRRKSSKTYTDHIFLDNPPETLNGELKQAGLKKVGENAMRYLVIVEKGPQSFGAYVPDLPGCIAAGESREEVLTLIRESIEFHLEGLREDGHPVPSPSSSSEVIEVETA
jgi:predicted RNase H-like HicB family nuclease